MHFGIAGTLLLTAAPSVALQFSVQQITDNTTSDHSPDVDGRYVAWSRFVAGASREIFQFDGVQTSRITSNGFTDASPAVSGRRIVWDSGDDDHVGTGGLSYYDGSSVSELLPTGSGAFSRDIDGGTIACTAYASSGAVDVFRYDGVSHEQLTNDARGQEGVRIAEARLVWMSNAFDLPRSWWGLARGYGTHFDPFLQQVGGDIVLDDAGAQSVLSAAGQRAFFPSVSRDAVAWAGWDGQDLEIFVHRNGQTQAITDNAREDREAEVSHRGVAWTGWDGNDYEVFFYDFATGTTTQLTMNAGHDFVGGASGSRVVWEGFDGNDWEFYLAIVPEPSTALLVALGLVGLAQRRARL